MKDFLNNEKIIFIIMGIIIVLITQGIKWACIKPFTKKLKSDKAKTVINSIIVLIAIGLGFVAEYFYSFKYLHKSFSVVEALSWSGAGQIGYAVLERVLKLFGSNKTIENPYKTEEGQAVTSLIENIVEDGKVDENDKSAIAEYLKSLGK